MFFPQDVKFYEASEGCRLSGIVGSTPGCVSCMDYVAAHMPGVMFDDACLEMEHSENTAEQIKGGRDLLDDENKPAYMMRPGFQVESTSSMDHEMYIKACALNANQVQTEYGKLPRP